MREWRDRFRPGVFVPSLHRKKPNRRFASPTLTAGSASQRRRGVCRRRLTKRPQERTSSSSPPCPPAPCIPPASSVSAGAIAVSFFVVVAATAAPQEARVADALALPGLVEARCEEGTVFADEDDRARLPPERADRSRLDSSDLSHTRNPPRAYVLSPIYIYIFVCVCVCRCRKSACAGRL